MRERAGSARRYLVLGTGVLAAIVAHVTMGERLARAQENRAEADACFTAAERAQPLMKERRFREARAELEMCARDVCPRVARTDCRDWLADVATQQPSIVIHANEVNSNKEVRAVPGIRAVIDGAIVLEKVDATPVPVDPGRHRLRVERPGFAPLEQNVEIREGEKARVINFFWQTPWVVLPPPAVQRQRPTPPSVYIMGTLGLVATGVGTYFEISGLGKRTSLDSCRPYCTQSQLDDALNTTRAGDITLGAGILLLTGSAILYLTRPSASATPQTDQLEWLLGPVPGGWMAGLHGSL